MDCSISYTLEQIACWSVVLKVNQVTCIYEGKDCLPTGFGKSLCCEVLPLIFDDKLGKDNSVVIVVSPLIFIKPGIRWSVTAIAANTVLWYS